MIAVGSVGDHRVRQQQHLAPRLGTADAATQLHRCVDQRFEIETIRQRAGQQQTSVGDQIRLIERHPDAVKRDRKSVV